MTTEPTSRAALLKRARALLSRAADINESVTEIADADDFPADNIDLATAVIALVEIASLAVCDIKSIDTVALEEEVEYGEQNMCAAESILKRLLDDITYRRAAHDMSRITHREMQARMH